MAEHPGQETYGCCLSAGPSRPVHVTSHWAFHLVNDSLAFSRAESFCRSQFSSLVGLDQLEDAGGLWELLQQTGLQHPLWVRRPSEAASKQREPKLQMKLKNIPKKEA